jgi:hypothetical protein
MSHIKIVYKKPREAFGKWLALNIVGGSWSDHYNEEQKEYWYMKADEALAYLKNHGLV